MGEDQLGMREQRDRPLLVRLRGEIEHQDGWRLRLQTAITPIDAKCIKGEIYPNKTAPSNLSDKNYGLILPRD